MCNFSRKPPGSARALRLYKDLPLTLKDAKLTMFADDATVYAPATTPDGLNVILNRELDTVEKWIGQNKLPLNTAKTVVKPRGQSHCFLTSFNMEDITV